MPRSAPFIVFGGNAPHPDQRGPFVGVDESVRWAEDLCRNLDERQRITDARSVNPEVGDHRGFLAGIAQLQQDLAESRLPPSSVWEQGRPRRIVPDTRARSRTHARARTYLLEGRRTHMHEPCAVCEMRIRGDRVPTGGGSCGGGRKKRRSFARTTSRCWWPSKGLRCMIGRAAYMQLHNRLREQLNTRPRAELAQMHRSGQRLRQSMLEACHPEHRAP